MKVNKLFLRNQFSLLIFLVLSMLVLSGCTSARETIINNYKQGDYEGVIRGAVYMPETSDVYWRMLGLSYIRTEQYDKGLDKLRRDVELKDSKTSLDIALSDIWVAFRLFKEGNYVDTMNKFKSAEPYLDNLFGDETGMDNFYSHLYKMYANSLERTGNTKGALEKYIKAKKYGATDSITTAHINTLSNHENELSKAIKAEEYGDFRNALKHYHNASKIISPVDNNIFDVRKRTILIVHKLDPPPAVPKDVERYVGRGFAAVKAAKSEADYKNAAREFQKALELAPWLPDIYYNLGHVQVKAGLYGEAIQSFKLYLLAAPDATDRNTIENTIYQLDYKREMIDRWKGTWVLTEALNRQWDTASFGSGTEEIRDTNLMIKVKNVSVSGNAEIDVYWDEYVSTSSNPYDSCWFYRPRVVLNGTMTNNDIVATLAQKTVKDCNVAGFHLVYTTNPVELKLSVENNIPRAILKLKIHKYDDSIFLPMTLTQIYTYNGRIAKLQDVILQ